MSQGVRARFGNFGGANEQNQSGPMPLNRPQFKMVVYNPKKFDDVQAMADTLMAKSGVLIYFENMDAHLKCRIVDYMNGLSYALAAQVEKVSDSIVLYVPENAVVENSAVESSPLNKWF